MTVTIASLLFMGYELGGRVMLTVKDWDDIATRLEPKVLLKCDKDEETYLWALYGGLLTHMKDTNMSIDEVLVICEEKVTGKKKGVSEDNERKSVQ